MGIEIGGYTFEGPVPLRAKFLCPCEGVYAILCPSTTPGKYKVVYIGQSRAVNERVDPGHGKWLCFHEACANPRIAFLAMPGSTPLERMVLERRLIRQLKPLCNQRGK